MKNLNQTLNASHHVYAVHLRPCHRLNDVTLAVRIPPGDPCETDLPRVMFKFTHMRGTNVVINQPQRTLCLIPTNILFTHHIPPSTSRGAMILAWPWIINSCAAVCVSVVCGASVFLAMPRSFRQVSVGSVSYTHIHTTVTSPNPAVQCGSTLPLGGIMMLNYSPQFE